MTRLSIWLALLVGCGSEAPATLPTPTPVAGIDVVRALGSDGEHAYALAGALVVIDEPPRTLLVRGHGHELVAGGGWVYSFGPRPSPDVGAAPAGTPELFGGEVVAVPVTGGEALRTASPPEGPSVLFEPTALALTGRHVCWVAREVVGAGLYCAERAPLGAAFRVVGTTDVHQLGGAGDEVLFIEHGELVGVSVPSGTRRSVATGLGSLAFFLEASSDSAWVRRDDRTLVEIELATGRAHDIPSTVAIVDVALTRAWLYVLARVGSAGTWAGHGGGGTALFRAARTGGTLEAATSGFGAATEIVSVGETIYVATYAGVSRFP